MTSVVFLGPTLPRDDARRILPDAVYLPPARQADIVTAIGRYHPDVIALIDGTFLHTLAVWHKEILHALDLGIRVFGASSMGALRAAECAEFGMVGVGRVFRDYADGTLTADDEVALSHADEASGWRPMSEAMVNVRATLTAAVAAGVLTEGEKDAVTAAGKALYFPERTWPAILARSGLDAAARRRVTKFAARHGVDLKRLDAEELLALVQAAIEAGDGLDGVLEKVAGLINDDAWNRCDASLDSYGEYDYDDHDSGDSDNSAIEFSKMQVRERVGAFLREHHPELMEELA